MGNITDVTEKGLGSEAKGSGRCSGSAGTPSALPRYFEQGTNPQIITLFMFLFISIQK